MVQTKHHSTPVVEKREVKKDCGCGCPDCTCGEDCRCGCCCGRGLGKTFWKCTTMLVSAVLISGAVLLQPCVSETLSSKRIDTAAPQLTEKDFGDFIRRNPRVLAETLDRYQAKQAQKAERVAAKKAAEAQPAPKPFSLNDLDPADPELVQSIIKDPSNYSLGNKNGKFVIIEFFDYQCGWCKRTNAALEEVIASEKGKNIRWIPVDYPIFGEASETIARYVLAAGAQGKYAAMHKAVGEAQGRLDEAALLEIAKNLKLNTKKLTADAKGDKVNAKLAKGRELGQKLGVHGVPMVIVDGRINPGALLGERLDKVVEAAQAKK